MYVDNITDIEDISKKIKFVIKNYTIKENRKSLKIVKESNYKYSYGVTNKNKKTSNKIIEGSLLKIEEFLSNEDYSCECLIYYSQLPDFSYNQLKRICLNNKINITMIDDNNEK